MGVITQNYENSLVDVQEGATEGVFFWLMSKKPKTCMSCKVTRLLLLLRVHNVFILNTCMQTQTGTTVTLKHTTQHLVEDSITHT